VTENGIKLYDDAFSVTKTRFGMYQSYDKEGNPIILGLDENGVVAATRFYLKGKQEGFENCSAHEGVVGGKL
jgi:hypothetical protein